MDWSKKEMYTTLCPQIPINFLLCSLILAFCSPAHRTEDHHMHITQYLTVEQFITINRCGDISFCHAENSENKTNAIFINMSAFSTHLN